MLLLALLHEILLHSPLTAWYIWFFGRTIGPFYGALQSVINFAYWTLGWYPGWCVGYYDYGGNHHNVYCS